MGWLIGIELPDELAERGYALSQSSIELREHRTNIRFYALKAPLDAVTLRSASDQKGPPWELPAERLRVFKLSGPDLARGRRIQRATGGTFLVIVPAGSRPERESPEWILAGPEQGKGASTEAYLVRVPADLAWDVVFINKDGGKMPLSRATARAELLGSTVDDELIAELGRLFVAEPPRLEARGEWRLATFVVVEEPTGERAWRARGFDFEALRPEVAAKGCGWFSVRCYDEGDDLIESLPFRFSASLEKIEIENPSAGALPGPAGHDEAVVRFAHRDGCCVTPAGTVSAQRVERESGGTRALVPRDSKYDLTRWQLADAQGKLTLAVRVERIWWAVAKETVRDSELAWTDELLDLRRDDFAATSARVLHVRLPRADWKVSVGFREDQVLPMQGSTGSSHRLLPLRNLTDQQDLEAVVGAPPLRLVVEPPQPAPRATAEVARVTGPRRERFRQRCVDTAALQPARVASVLTRVARSLRGRQRRALLKFRREHYARGRGSHDALREEFVRKAHCLLDVLLERRSVPPEALRRRWRARAHDAGRTFPDIREEVERFLARAMNSSLR